MLDTLKENSGKLNRRSFLTRASLMGGAVLLPFAALKNASGAVAGNLSQTHSPLVHGLNRKILMAAEIAEALAVTTYMNIINTSSFYLNLSASIQSYLTAALQEEMSHYLLEADATAEATPYTTFYYPPNMFSDPQTTLNTLVTLEEAFIAAYLVGIRDFSTSALRVTAARIMGVESDHRSLARIVGAHIASQDGGPLATITGVQGVAESVTPANNNGYERTLKWTNIDQALAALTPFVDLTAAGNVGFDTSASFSFEPFTPTLATPLGDFISFNG